VGFGRGISCIGQKREKHAGSENKRTALNIGSDTANSREYALGDGLEAANKGGTRVWKLFADLGDS